MQTIDNFVREIEATYGTTLDYEVVADPKNDEHYREVAALVIKGTHDLDLADMIIRDLGGLTRWPIAATGGKEYRRADDPLWIYKTPIHADAIMILFSEEKGA